MNYRPLGKTGLNVSEVGMGTWQLAGNPWGWDAPGEKESMKALYRFVERTDRLKALLGEEAQTLPELALRYILSFDEISTVIPGTRKVAYVDANVSVSDGRALPVGLMEELKKHARERNFYPDVDPALAGDGYIEV